MEYIEMKDRLDAEGFGKRSVPQGLGKEQADAEKIKKNNFMGESQKHISYEQKQLLELEKQ